MKNFYKGKDVLVTGGAGSIGSEIVKRLFEHDVKKVRIFDNSESGLFHLGQEIKGKGEARLLLGDVRDRERLMWALNGVDVVFHAAALKHIPLCEYNTFEAVRTNVIGTQNMVEAAKANDVEKVLAISTDKAVNPINTLGASKLLAEKLILGGMIGETKTRFSCVRFGNVLNTDGSVIPLFKAQISEGGPVTVTSPEMTRFCMPISGAVDLMLRSMAEMRGAEIFILKMKALRILDLAEVMIEELAPRYGYRPKDIKIEITGRRHGEKISELLLCKDEIDYLEDRGTFWVVRPGLNTPHCVINEKARRVMEDEYSSSDVVPLAKEEIRRILRPYLSPEKNNP